MSNTTIAVVSINATQHVALAKISKGNPADDTLRPGTVQAFIRRDLVEIDPDGVLTLTEVGHAFLGTQDAAQEPKGKGDDDDQGQGLEGRGKARDASVRSGRTVCCGSRSRRSCCGRSDSTARHHRWGLRVPGASCPGPARSPHDAIR